MRLDKKNTSFLIASLLFLPFLLLPTLLLIGAVQSLFFGDCTDIVAVPVLGSVWWVSGFPMQVSLSLGGASLVLLLAWFQSVKTRVVCTLLSLYSIALVLCVAYLVWWHASGSVFDL